MDTCQAPSKVASLLSWLFDGYWPAPDEHPAAPVQFQGARQRYTLDRLLAVGDTADVHLATAAEDLETTVTELFLVKATRDNPAHLDVERQALTRLLAAAGETTYRKYLPLLVESLTRQRTPRRINVFRYESGFYTLAEVHAQHPVLDGRHLAWIFKRLLTVLGFGHRQGILHGAILPEHVLIHAASHGLRLVGWGHSVGVGQRISSVPDGYRDWYPREVQRRQPASSATDLFLAARCIVYLAGGDPLANRLPQSVPAPLRRFVNTCLLDSARMRPDDAWAVLEDLDDLLRSLYGPPTFHELTLS